MDLRQLAHFIAIVEAGSLGRAADQAGVTQQALSKSLARLEQETGTPLAERTPKGIKLTPAGELLLPSAQAMLAEAGRFQREAEVLAEGARGRLVVGLSLIAAAGPAGQATTRFALQNPRLRLDVETGIYASFAGSLLRGEIDMGVAVVTTHETSSNRIATKVIGEALWGIAGRADHPIFQITADDTAGIRQCLSSVQWLLGRNTGVISDMVNKDFAKLQLPPPRPGVMTTSVEFLLRALNDSDMLTIVAEPLVAKDKNLAFRSLPGAKWTTPMVLMRRRRGHQPLLLTKLASLIEAEMAAPRP